MNKRFLMAAAVLTGLALTNGNKALAQNPGPQTISGPSTTDDDINLFRKDVRSLKKQIIAANMDLTDTEAQQFWPIYDRYTAELSAIADTKYSLLKDYARNYSTMTNEGAESYVKGRAAVVQSEMQLRLKYFPIFCKVLPAKSTAKFFQIDWRLGLIMDLQLASQTPLLEP